MRRRLEERDEWWGYWSRKERRSIERENGGGKPLIGDPSEVKRSDKTDDAGDRIIPHPLTNSFFILGPIF